MAVVDRYAQVLMETRIRNFPKKQVNALAHRSLETYTLNYGAYSILDSGVYTLGSVDNTNIFIKFNLEITSGFVRLFTNLISIGDPLADSQVEWSTANRTIFGFTLVLRETTPEVKNLKLVWSVMARESRTILTTP